MSYVSIRTQVHNTGANDLAEPLLLHHTQEPMGQSTQDSDQDRVTRPLDQDIDEETKNEQALIYRILGFPKPIGCPGYFLLSSSLLHMAMLSNLATSYNVINVGYVLDLIANSNEIYAAQRSSSSDGLCASSLLFGMVLGQLCGGVLGDRMSRQRALLLVICIQVASAFGSSMLVFDLGDNLTIYDTLAFWRFFLGLGCGGVYPLAATMTSELVSSSANHHEEWLNDEVFASKVKSKLVAITFSTQGLGFLLVPLVTWTIVSILDADSSARMSGIAWRSILVIGCIPGLLVLVLQAFATRHGSYERMQEEKIPGYGNKAPSPVQLPSQSAPVPRAVDVSWMEADSDDEQSDSDLRGSHIAFSVWTAIRNEPNIGRKLGGTALCWFLFDVLFYGNTLFTPVVLKQAFGSSETVASTAHDAFILTLFALPGYILSVLTLGRILSPKWVQMQGFATMGILYLIIGVEFKVIEQFKMALLILYGMTFMFANWGPNTTTFMLPSLTFSKECRSTLNGISAASGKMGALLGSTAFEPVAKRYGDAIVMILCAGVSAVGFLLTFLCLESDKSRTRTDSPSQNEAAAHQQNQRIVSHGLSIGQDNGII